MLGHLEGALGAALGGRAYTAALHCLHGYAELGESAPAEVRFVGFLLFYAWYLWCLRLCSARLRGAGGERPCRGAFSVFLCCNFFCF